MTAGQKIHRGVRIPVLGMVSGLLGAFGLLILLQQYEVVYPTRTMTIAFLAGGVALNLVVANVAVALTGRTQMVPSGVDQPTVTDVRTTIDATTWTPTHRIPRGGLPAWTTPDPAAPPVDRLDPGLDVTVDRREGDWAHVMCSNGWTAWVDGRLLQELSLNNQTPTDLPRLPIRRRPNRP